MNNQVKIIEREEENTLQIYAEAAMMKMPVAIGNAYKKIMQNINEQKTEAAGAPFVRYLEINWDKVNTENKFAAFIKMFTRKWKMEIGFPVKNNIDGTGEIKKSTIPKGKYLKSLHRGPYQKVGYTYKRMTAFTKQNNLAIKNESIEIYLNDPRTTKKENLETIVLIPLEE
ncbi:MAG: GyrI-like domain-containing protein [Ignavibacteriales bacterium]|nr:GyrI-like domain-containing protein [Ignavibacteriales bacterium]